jgi:hypothetical protein
LIAALDRGFAFGPPADGGQNSTKKEIDHP